MNNPKLLRFTEWLATPLEEREPQTQKELALELGVKESQLSIWKRDLQLQTAKPSEITEFKNQMYKLAMDGKNAMYAKLWWEMVNPDKKDARGAEFTADDYINIGIKTLEGLREQNRQGNRSCPVCGRCKEIRNEPRLDTESGKEEDREVAGVAVPARPD